MHMDTDKRAHEEAELIFQHLFPAYGLVVRQEQLRLCHFMLDCLLNKKISLCDAGVGIGKTYAYLVAGILARKYSIGLCCPVVISTSSVALQEAIVREYVPFVSEVLVDNGLIDRPLSTIVCKGKERFVCDQRLSLRLKAVEGKRKNARQYAALQSLRSQFDLDSVAALSDFDRRQVCVPKTCPLGCEDKETCRYYQYRRRSQMATVDFQICNHNYLIADAVHRQHELRPLLRKYGALIVDEAHKIPEAAMQMYGVRLSVQDFEELCMILKKETSGSIAEKLWKSGECLFESFHIEEQCEDERRLPYKSTSVGRACLRNCILLCQQIQEQEGKKIPQWIGSRLEKLKQCLRIFLEQQAHYILYLQYDSEGCPSLCAASRDTARKLRRALWDQHIPIILTSGTLMAGESFRHIIQNTGLDEVQRVKTFTAPSPFEYEKNCLLYFPAVKNAAWGSAAEAKNIAEMILRLVESTYGHTLVLFTSYALMGTVYQLVKSRMEFPLFVVWRNSQETVRAFKEESNAVLFAAGSCWEGMDFPGDAVSSLIIPRLPFPVPDPILEAKQVNYMSLQDYIRETIIPEMQLKLRQGFGRAIRIETDTCVVSILDPRAAPGQRYFKAVVEALPTMRVTRKPAEIERFIRRIKPPEYFLNRGTAKRSDESATSTIRCHNTDRKEGENMTGQAKEAAVQQKSAVVERECGPYKVKVCFAEQNKPGADRDVLDAIMRAYRHRMEQQA